MQQSPLVVSLDVTSDDWYEVTKSFPANEEFYNNEELIIHVRAVFNNDESINSCIKTVLSNPNNPNFVFDKASVAIRGDIKDYELEALNYRIDIYKEIPL